MTPLSFKYSGRCMDFRKLHSALFDTSETLLRIGWNLLSAIRTGTFRYAPSLAVLDL